MRRDFADVWMSAREIDGWLTEGQARMLYQTAAGVDPGDAIVEIGSHCGRSTVILGSAKPAATTLVAIDPYGDARWGGGGGALESFEANLARHGLEHEVHQIRRFGAQAGAEWSGDRVGLLFVDGAHDYATVDADLRAWLPHLSPTATVLMHDAYSSPGVTRAAFRHFSRCSRVRVRGLVALARGVPARPADRGGARRKQARCACSRRCRGWRGTSSSRSQCARGGDLCPRCSAIERPPSRIDARRGHDRPPPAHARHGLVSPISRAAWTAITEIFLEHLPEAQGILIGSPSSAPSRVTGVSDAAQPLVRRLLAFWQAAQRAADGVDVVDAHFALYALAPLWLGRLGGKPAVLHFHGPWADESASLDENSRARRGARRLLERAAYHRADEAIVLSSAFRQVLVERYGVSPWSVNVEPPGVDVERSPVRGDRAAAPRASGRGFCRRGRAAAAVPRMGLESLVHAWAAAVDRLPAPATLLIAGDGPLRSKLGDAIAAAGAQDRVRLLGPVSDERLVDCYRAADVAIVPSVEHEGFGLVVIEAAACGTPSIVTAVGGLPETIAGLDPSLIVPAGDWAALRDRLLRALHELPTRDATRLYAEGFRWSNVAARHRKIARRAQSRVHGDDRLRVVYLDHVAKMSGGEIALLRLVPHLHDVRPHVILAEDGPLVQALHLAGISTEVLPFPDPARRLSKDSVRLGGVSPRIAATSAQYVMRLALRLRSLRARPRAHELAQGRGVRQRGREAGRYPGDLACSRPHLRGLPAAAGGQADPPDDPPPRRRRRGELARHAAHARGPGGVRW